MISVNSTGSFRNTDRFLDKILRRDIRSTLNKYGQVGVSALKEATPVDSGVSADSWGYKVEKSNGNYSIAWTNGNETSDGTPIVILLQYGHATNGGGYVQGRDFINPAIKPIFDQIADDVWREVQR